MAKNTGRGSRIGAVKSRTQVKNPHNNTWVKRGSNGRFMDAKSDQKPFKGVTKER